jgi:class 3 adenylate cyclase
LDQNGTAMDSEKKSFLQYLSWQLPPGLEDAYQTEKVLTTTKNVSATIRLVFIVIIISFIFGFFFLAPPEQRPALVKVGLIGCSMLLVAAWAMTLDLTGRRRAAFLQPAFMILAVYFWMYYYVIHLPLMNKHLSQGLAVLFIFGSYVIERLNPWAGILAGIGTSIVYLALRHHYGLMPPETYVQTFAQILTTNVFGIHILLSNARFDRRQFMMARELEAERFLSDDLLKKILPAAIAPKLRSNQQLPAESVSAASILFADLVGFTSLTERVSPNQLVSLLNDIFSRFDRLAEEYGVEKIKTIGDGYMAVAGCLEDQPDHALRAARLAVAMRDDLQDFAARNGLNLKLRIGIHSGPVIAGVIGEKRFGFDVWGDSVNTASRMESSARPGDIQISSATAELIGSVFQLSEEQQVEVKGKGFLSTRTIIAPFPT